MINYNNKINIGILFITFKLFIICLKVGPHFKISNNNNKSGIMYILGNFFRISVMENAE